MFDFSHLTQICVRANSGRLADAAAALERAMPVDIVGLAPGRRRYGVVTASNGGVLADVTIAHDGDHFLLVASPNSRAIDDLMRRLEGTCTIELRGRALIALQGPLAETVLTKLAVECAYLRFGDVTTIDIRGLRCLVARSSPIGTDGFEIACDAGAGCDLAGLLLADPSVTLAGHVAQELLRIEAGIVRLGSDFDAHVTPVGAGLAFTIGAARRTGGARAGGFPGADVILDQLGIGAPVRRVGLRVAGPDILPSGTRLFARYGDTTPIGTVTSSGWSPTLSAPLAMATLRTDFTASGGVVASVDGACRPVTVSALPFVPHTCRRRRVFTAPPVDHSHTHDQCEC